MKKVILKYTVSVLAAVALMATPVLGASLSGSQLLERFDRIHVLPFLTEFQQNANLDEEMNFTEDDNSEDSNTVIIIVEEDTPYYAEDTEDNEEHSDEDNIPFENEYEYIPTPVQNFDVPGFAITSGINRNSESTFDNARTIVGTAPRGTLVRIEVFGYRESTDSFYKVSGSVLTVGASGNFSSVQPLRPGHNFIRIQAIYNDYRSEASYISIETAQLNRISNEVRNQLERGLLLP